MSGFTVKTPGIVMSLLSVDGGGPVESHTASSSSFGILYPGERVDVIVDWESTLPGGVGYLDIILDREYALNQPCSSSSSAC